jgi:hypothetical protein
MATRHLTLLLLPSGLLLRSPNVHKERGLQQINNNEYLFNLGRQAKMKLNTVNGSQASVLLLKDF